MTISAVPAAEAVFTLDAAGNAVFANEAGRQLLSDAEAGANGTRIRGRRRRP